LKEKQEQRKLKELERIEQLKRKRESDSDTDVSDNYEPADDDLVDISLSVRESCYACDAPLDQDELLMLVQCQKCGKWLHKVCVKTIDLLSLSEVEIEALEFECDYC